jgi:hypothetical protein
MLENLEFRGEEIILTRSRHKIARIIPGSPPLTALQAMGDQYRTLPDDVGAAWAAESRISLYDFNIHCQVQILRLSGEQLQHVV